MIVEEEGRKWGFKLGREGRGDGVWGREKKMEFLGWRRRGEKG